MGTGLALLGVAAAALGAAVTWLARARRLARRARQRDALVGVAERVDAAVVSLRSTPVPRHGHPVGAAAPPTTPTSPAGTGRPGRAALLDALHEAVAGARAERTRLSAGVVDAEAELGDDLVQSVEQAANAPVYVVGPRSVAIVFPGRGRAAALGVLARLQAAHGLEGRVVELEHGEGAVELATRLLVQPAE